MSMRVFFSLILWYFPLKTRAFLKKILNTFCGYMGKLDGQFDLFLLKNPFCTESGPLALDNMKVQEKVRLYESSPSIFLYFFGSVLHIRLR